MRTDDERHFPIRLRMREYGRFAEAMGLDDQVALSRALGMAHTTVGRVLAEQMAPGPRFVANSMHVLGVTFEAVFTTNPDPELLAVGASRLRKTATGEAA